MDEAICDRDVDLEYIGSVGTSRSKSSTTTLFPPILPSQPTSPETNDSEEPPLCKKIVHVHREASEKQQKLDAAWLDTEEAGRVSRLPVRPIPESCSTANSLWEHLNVEVEKSPIMLRLPSIRSIAHFSKQKLSIYARQWRDGLSCSAKQSMIEACARVTVSNWIWCLVLGTWLEQKTAKKWGLVECVLANAICGFLFELLGGQAILVVGPSSPSVIFIIAITTTAKRLGVDAAPWMGWIGLWASLVLLLLALSNACKIMSHVTFFSWGVVCIFIRLTFLWAAIEQIVHMFTDPNIPQDSALFSLWLATTAFFVLLMLENVRNWQAFEHQTQHALADYGPVFVLLFFTALPLLPKLNRTHISQVSLPKFGYHTDQLARLGCVTLRLLPIWAILLAVVPGIMLAGVLFIHQNATSNLLQDEAGLSPLYKNSRKWDLCIVSFLVLLCSFFGLPYACGMLCQSQVHVRALTLKLHEYSDVEDQRRLVTKVRVQRVSGMMASLLTAAILLPPIRRILTRIPLGILTGLLLEFACKHYGSWDISIVIIKFFSRKREKPHRRTTRSALCIYTVAQISCVLIILIVSKTPAAVMFPLFILVTLWVRHSAMRHFFKRGDFAKLDTKLPNDGSDMSSSGQLSIASHDVHAHVQLDWPKISIPQTLKSAITVPMKDVHVSQAQNATCVDGVQADIVAESGESPLPISPSVLHVSTRRLKERSRRRCKRKRQISIDTVEIASNEKQPEEHIPPLVKAMMQKKNYPFEYEQDEEINLSKRVSPRLSPKFFRKSKQRAGEERPLEVHSNLLYEPKKVIWKPRPERKLQSEEPSTSTAFALEDNENDIQSANPRQETVWFHGSPGIGRCIRSPPAVKRQSPTSMCKKKQLQLSIALPQRRTFSKEEAYPGNVPTRPYYPRLRRSRTSRWPTTHHAPHHHLQHEQHRHSISASKDDIDMANLAS